MPRHRGDSRDRAELVNNVARDEVDVVVVKLDVGITYALPPHQVQLGVVNPGHTLCSTRTRTLR